MNAGCSLKLRLRAAVGEGGFSVVEGLVSLTLLTLSISGTASLFGAAAVHDATSVQATAAVAVLQAQLHALRDLRYDHIPVGVATSTHMASNTVFAITRTITNADPQPNMKRIRVVASCNQRGRRSNMWWKQSSRSSSSLRWPPLVNERGFTLLDMIVSIMVSAVVVMAAVSGASSLTLRWLEGNEGRDERRDHDPPQRVLRVGDRDDLVQRRRHDDRRR